jgi:hypothetical protein
MKASLLFLCASLVFGQTTRSTVTNGRVESRPFGGDLKQQIASNSPAWFGYVVTTTGRQHDSCCWGGEGLRFHYRLRSQYTHSSRRK